VSTTTATDNRPEVRAEAKWLRISPRKARLVADHLRGRSVLEARTVLAFSERAAAREISKVLESAVANAGTKHNLGAEDLVVSAAYVDVGPVLKRFRARARGRVARIRKRTCHVTIRLTGIPAQPPAQPAEQPKPRKRPATAGQKKPATARKRAPAKKKTEEAKA
jgi:large subunit ribosomal protein L22